ncbi:MULTISPECIES: FprA family A-type flavoprotein [unclassified Methanoculleus]|uniref:FprA family A-type flavoprotein n=2 Tax=Methanoculleus TaxID=45989 RepID=UPI0025D8966B|nr:MULTISPECIES: FprA family A-type flavoprotein [unclassified Methanoculleus]MCK9317910.1 FprA family A-type flavoprotein [Methanoculleus sp.]MDD2253700.1 FprA family A-type flavoprotein [Methanoculleus sp.]MDD2788023.1 FprA family A-type flavoprotein [Methanoculleus sp.]MDD4314499.1 FprA family A-type flavoprotein [Methanoculleus sp.]MDD4470736.1 FprA family A-type flavoprotein [Methanoculleus sp.]
MTPREIVPGVFAVGAIDWDRRIFDELIPTPDGTSYNSYLLRGSEKTALIDTVDPSKFADLTANLDRLGVDKIDYIIANHAEQDHSGSIPAMLGRYPGAKVVTNQKCRDFLVDLLQIPQDRVIVISDGDTLTLGDRTLEFIFAPWVHWPETMLTYLPEDRILFSCDLFGSHYATSSLYVPDEGAIYESAKRYYAEIMMPFRSSIKAHLAKLAAREIAVIAPSHGPVYDRPAFIMDAYRDWTGDDVRNVVVLPFVSMHGSTQAMVDHFTTALIQRGVQVHPFNLTKTDIGELAKALVDAATVVIGTPTLIFGPHPQVVYAAYLANLLRPKTRYASVIGSYGWGGKTVDTLASMLDRLKVELIEPVYIKGYPREGDFAALDRLADAIRKKHEEAGIIPS